MPSRTSATTRTTTFGAGRTANSYEPAAEAADYSELNVTHSEEMYAQAPMYINLQNNNESTDEVYEMPVSNLHQHNDTTANSAENTPKTGTRHPRASRARAASSTGSTNPVSKIYFLPPFNII